MNPRKVPLVLVRARARSRSPYCPLGGGGGGSSRENSKAHKLAESPLGLVTIDYRDLIMVEEKRALSPFVD